MIIIFNWIGAGILVAALAIGASLEYLFGLSPATSVSIVCAPIIIALDLLYRAKVGERQFFHPRTGGHLFFIPVWILASFWFLAGIFAPHHPAQVRASERYSPSARNAEGQPATYQASVSSPNPAAATTSARYQVAESSQGEAQGNSVKLGMISGTGERRVATINGEPFTAGETHKVRAGNGRVLVQCLEIRDQSVLAKIDGNPTELKLGQPFPPVINR